MKKLRFFGLLAATVLLAFALVVACSNGSTEPPDGPGPVEPNGPPAYSIPPGGTGPGTTGIPKPGDPPATAIRLHSSVLMVEVGGAIYLGWDPIPSNGYVTSIDWNSTSASNVAVSNTGLVVGLATDGGKPVKATITAQAKVGSDAVGSVVECEVTVYDKGTLSSTTGADLALLGWDLLLDYKNGANTSLKREAVTSAADIRVKALTKSEIKDMATLGSQALLSTKVDTPVYGQAQGGPPGVIAYYPVLKGAQYFDLDFARTGWSFVSMSGGVPTGTQSGNRISVSENGNSVEREIGYPVDGIDPANWPHITVRVIPCAEVTFSMPKALKDNLNADNLLLTADQGSTILLNLVSKSNTGAEALTGFNLGTTDSTNPQDVGYLKSSNGDLTRTALIWANFPDTKIRFLTKVETSTAPADYHLTASWGALPASTQFSATYSEYAVGGLASDSYDIRLTRGADVEIPSITIRDISLLSIGDTLQNFSTSPANIGIISAIVNGTPTWHATPPSANTNPATLAANYTAKAGEKLYAKIVLDPAKGYKFSDTIAVTCVGPDPDYTGTGTPPEISYANVLKPYFGTGANATQLNVVLEFTVKLGEVNDVTLTLARPAVGDNPNSLRVTTVSDAAMLQNPATVNWTLGGAPWSQVVAKTGDVFTAQVTIRAIEGYEFGTPFNTIAATDFAASSAKINFPGANEIGTTAPTAILSNDRKALTITVTFAAIP